MPSRALWVVLVVALALRLLVGLSQDPAQPYTDTGGDTRWYLASGYALVTGRQPPTMTIDVSQLASPPVYLVFIGAMQALFAPEAAVIAIRVIQALMGAAACYFAGRLAWRLTGSPRAGLVAAGVLAVSPAFIVEASLILTETTYIFFVAAGLAAYVEWLVGQGRLRLLALAALLLGLASLTRAVFILFPLGLALHLLLVCGLRRGLGRAVLLLLVYSLVVSTWTIYNLARWNRFVIGGDGIAAFLYIGATGWDSPESVDERLADDLNGQVPDDATSGERQDAYVEGATEAIGSNPIGYLARRVRELAGAYAQPHGTVFFSGPSLRELAAGWWRDDRTLAGLLALAGAEAFWPKLAIYTFHYAGIGLGLAGLWRTRRRWQVSLVLVGFIAYTTLVHLFLLALPRYIFPTAFAWWVLGAAALAPLLFRQQRESAVDNRPVNA